MSAPAAGGKEEMSTEHKESVARRLVCSEFFFVTAVAMVIPTRAPIVLDIKKGDAVATARILGLMSSSAAFIELFINPVFGQLSDMYGRKPFFIIAPAVNAFLHSLVWLFPKALYVNFIDRMISGSMIFSFKAPLSAALTDLFSAGPTLGMWLARQSAAFGLGLAVGPFVGSRIGGAKSFIASALVFLGTMVFTSTGPETLGLEDRKQFNIAACSPLRFLKLFNGRNLSTLTLTVGLQSFGDYLNVYDINYLYLKTIFDVGQAEVGRYASSVGLSTFISGYYAMPNAIKQAGLKGATLGANVMWALAMGLFGSARSVGQVGVSLLAMCGGHARNAGVAAYIQTQGQALGMGRAEIAGAQANFLAVLKVMIPLFYGNLFAWATSKGRNMPGFPYFVIAFLTAVSQLCFWSIDPDETKKK